MALCRLYSYPLYAFVRRRGYNPKDAQDLTRDFFCICFEVSDVPVHFPFWIDYDGFITRCDEVKELRESQNKKSLDTHHTHFRCGRVSFHLFFIFLLRSRVSHCWRKRHLTAHISLGHCLDLRFRGKDQRPNSQSIRWTSVPKPPDLFVLRLAHHFLLMALLDGPSDKTTISLFINRFAFRKDFVYISRGTRLAWPYPISVLFLLLIRQALW